MRLNTSLIALISDDNELGDAGAEHIATLITRERLSLAHLRFKYSTYHIMPTITNDAAFKAT